ncbi:hypothetical protein LguiA_028834 [Lonicera macranthoides]
MASNLGGSVNQNLPYTHKTTAIFRWRIPLRRRRQATVRLGGKKKTRRGVFLARLVRRVRLKLKKIKDYYNSLVKDMIEAGSSLEAFQQRLLLETSFGVPVMGLSFNTFPSSSSYALDRPSITM